MPNLKKIFRYLGHYGLRSTVGLVREKLLVDPKRFSAEKVRKSPDFPPDYQSAPLPETDSQTPVSVLYLIHYFYPAKKGGTERFTLNLAKEQQRLGNSPMVLVLEANEPMSVYTDHCGDIAYRYYEYDGVPCIAFRYKKAPLGLYYKSVRLDDAEMQAFARHLIAKRHIDVVHATYPQPFASFLEACRADGVPYLVTCTDFCMMCHYSTMVDNNGDFCAGTEGQTKCSRTCATYGCKDFSARHAAAAHILSHAAAVTVPSAFVARVMSREFPGIAFVPVSHGISEAFAYAERHGKVRKFVYAGTLTSLKGVHLLVEAFCALEEKDITLDIYGDGDETYVSRLRALADARVHFRGAAPGDAMPRIYAEADCVIVPSMWYETYNFVLREAIATGALGLASDIGAMPEAVDIGENGLLFAPADKADLTVALQKALTFDFADYRPRKFPTTPEEGKVYSRVYRAIAK